MRYLCALAVCVFSTQALIAQSQPPGPDDTKAQKYYKEGMEDLQRGLYSFALGSFKKADKLDGGKCLACQEQMIKCGIQENDWKAVEFAASEEIDEAGDAKGLANAHFAFGLALMSEAETKRKAEFNDRAHEELTKALASDPDFAPAVYNDGLCLARAHHDDQAKAEFEHYLKIPDVEVSSRNRIERFIQNPELARGRMPPAFSVTLLDGQRLSLDDLAGKVVLLDFWASWCGPCREALPHLKSIAEKFQGQPFVILSISLDDDQRAWKSFVAKNGMTWLNYDDGGFKGPLSTAFGIQAIPHTFVIDADGMLQSEAVGDMALEGKIKKLIARASPATAKVGEVAH